MDDHLCLILEKVKIKKRALNSLGKHEKILYEEGYNLTKCKLEELHIDINQEYNSYWHLLYLNYLENNLEITKPYISSFISSIDALIKYYPTAKNSLHSTYISTFLNWINHCKTTKEILFCISKLSNLFTDNTDYYPSILSLAESKFIFFMQEKILKVCNSEGISTKYFSDILKELKKANYLVLKVSLLIDLFYLYAISYLEEILAINSSQIIQDKLSQKNIDGCRILLGHLINIQDKKEYRKRILKITSIIGSGLNEDDINKTIFLLDYNQLIDNSLIFEEENERIKLRVIESKDNENRVIAIKEYTAKKILNDLQFIEKEIQYLKMLSDHASDQNSFLKFYGDYHEDNIIRLYLEYYNNNLMKTIEECAIKNKRLNSDQINKIHLLINAFSMMEALKVNHWNITPHNILINSNFDFKIANLRISKFFYEIEDIEDDIKEFGLNRNNYYAAPEQLEYLNDNTVKIDVNKAEVFSLGLIILQMILVLDINGYNLKANHEKLYILVSDINETWIRDMLYHMLKLNPKERIDFKSAMQFIPPINTLFN